MKERVISGIIMTLVVVPVLLIGGILFDIAIGLVAVAAFKELLDARKDNKIPTIMKFVGLICMLMLTYSSVDTNSIILGLSYEKLSLVFILLLVPTVLIKKDKYPVSEAFYLACTSLFLGTVFNLFITVFMESKYVFILLILIACITDIFALFGGKLIGKHKLTKISPKKTVEGSITGTVFATIIATTYYATLISNETMVRTVILIILLSVMGQIGDLFFSKIKRENDIKDFSNLIPGHGGILDRIDSLIFVLITYVFLIQFL